jgi:membrane-bound metal-dependent hydrolase YbcI (DUF457 family)
MNIFTHALLPVILTGVATKRPDLRGRWALVAVGVAGGLPDILNPHLTLEARMTSWSHGIPCWLLLTTAMILIAASSRKRISVPLVFVLSGAYLLHIFCDAISGGVNFLYPFGNWTWGRYWVDPVWWIPLDVICFLTCYGMFRVAPMWKARKLTKPETA